MFLTIVIFLITISILVTVHEFGHFIVARWCGVKVESFSIGFGKKLCSYTSKKGTQFSLSLIPLGGYVKMLDGRNEELADDEMPFAYDHKPIFKRIAIVIAGPIANFLLAVVIYWIIFQIGVTSLPVKIQSTLPNTPAASVNIPSGVELKSISGIKVDSWQDVNLALLGEMGKDQLVLTYQTDENLQHDVLVDIKNWHFDIEKESPIKAFGLEPSPLEVLPIISQIIPNSAAEKAGIRVGDVIVAYDNKPYDSWDDFVIVVKAGKPIQLDIEREHQRLLLELVPSLEINSKGERVGVAGIYPSHNTIVKQYGIVSALIEGANQTKLTIKLVVRSFYQLISGVISVKHLSGPISIAQGAATTAGYGLVPYLYFLAFISVSLGVINLVPLPMLDGGHVVFLLIEKIKGSPLSKQTLETCYRLGFVLLMIVMGIALFNDFMRWLL